MTSFEKALAFTLKWEGGFANNPNDPGGRTMKGVTQKTYDAYRSGKGLGKKDVKLIENDELNDIYFNNFWLKAGCDKIAEKTAISIFDFVVNSGFGSKSGYGGMQIIQRLFNVEADGVSGPNTVNAINAAIAQSGDSVVADGINTARIENFMRLGASPKLTQFVDGWLNRAHSLQNYLKRA